MRKLRMAVIGAGRLGGFHAQKLAGFEDVELCGVVDPSADQRMRVANAAKTTAYADFSALADELDAVVLASPTFTHHALAADLLARGLHVLVEKPICTTLEEADHLVELARRSGVVLQVGHVERFNPAFVAAAAELRQPKYIDAVRTSPFTFRSTDVGAVLDVMIHDIDLVLALVQSPVRNVTALGAAVVAEHEDVANARIDFANGCVATISASRVSYETMRRMQVWTRERFAAIDFAARTTNVVRPSETLLNRDYDLHALTPAQLEADKQSFAATHLPHETAEFASVDALTLELRDFVESIREGQSPRVTGEAGRDALAVAERILDEIRHHAWEGRVDGPVGPHFEPATPVITAPQFQVEPGERLPQRRAG